MEGQNFREFVERYANYIIKSNNGNEYEQEPIIGKDVEGGEP